MPRLFTALELSPQAEAALGQTRGGLFGARWIDPENYHITLRFIGDVDTRTTDEIADHLRRVERPVVRIAFEGLGWFGGDRPRAIVARVKYNPALADLQSDHERRLRRLGLPPETRNFIPHVTLARMRSPSAMAVADYLAARGALDAPSFDAHRFVLYSSRDSVGGGPYGLEAAYPLR
jgi:2'-5' RNA ligase